MFERFTDRARRVTVLAQEEARLCGHKYVGTEHFLAALIHEEEGVAGQVLTKDFGFTLEGVRGQIETIIGLANADLLPQGHVPFTPRAKKCLELALREALQLGHNFIATEHLLLGLVRLDEGVGCRILAAGINGDMQLEVRKAVIRQINVADRNSGNDSSLSVRVAGSATQGAAAANWGPQDDGEDLLTVWAPVNAADDLVALATAVRDEIAGLSQAKTLLEKFGFTVTAPAPKTPEQ